MAAREDDGRREGLSPSGGIVADEAGLGKTLMSLALLLSHRGGDCPCHSEEAQAPSLIICPRAVRRQWLSELELHCRPNSLEALELRPPTERRTTEAELRAVDVVVASYETVRSQWRRGRSHSPSSSSPPSPLFSLSFHRIVCDEAHRLRSRKAQVTQAVLALKGRHRFFVTATPLTNSLDDLYTAFAFLRYAPYSDYRQWRRWMHSRDGKGMERARTLLQGCMLRRRKALRPPQDAGHPASLNPSPSSDAVLMTAKTVLTATLSFKAQSVQPPTAAAAAVILRSSDGRR